MPSVEFDLNISFFLSNYKFKLVIHLMHQTIPCDFSVKQDMNEN